MLSYLSDTLAVLATEEDSPGDAARVLSLQEQRLGLAILESEDLAVATDVKLTLQLQNCQQTAFSHIWANVSAEHSIMVRWPQSIEYRPGRLEARGFPSRDIFLQLTTAAIDSSAQEVIGDCVPFQGRSSGRRKYRRTSSLWRLVIRNLVLVVATSRSIRR